VPLLFNRRRLSTHRARRRGHSNLKQHQLSKFVSSLSQVIVRKNCNYCSNEYAHTHVIERHHCRYQGRHCDARSAALQCRTPHRRKSPSRYGRAPVSAQDSLHLLRVSSQSSHSYNFVRVPYMSIRDQGIKKLWRERTAAILSIGSRARLPQSLLSGGAMPSGHLHRPIGRVE